jgi:membrane peptidoglycan carboxypeptidase
VSTSDFPGSGRSHRRAAGPAGSARADSPQGDGYGGGNGYRPDGSGYRQGRGDGQRGQSQAAGYGRDGGTRAAGPYADGATRAPRPPRADGNGRPGGRRRADGPPPGGDSDRYGLGRRAGGGSDGYGAGRRAAPAAAQAERGRGGYGGGRHGGYGRPDGGAPDGGLRDNGYGRPGGGAPPGGGPQRSGFGRRGGGALKDAGPRQGRYGGADGYGDDGWLDDDGPEPGRAGRRGVRGRAGRGPGRAGDGGRGPRSRRTGGRKDRPKRKGDWWRRWTWKKALGVVCSTFGVLIIALAGLVTYGYASTPIPTDVSATALDQASTVYFSNGTTPIGNFGSVNRQVLTFNQIPAQLRNAVLAAEDRNFYHEGGVSPTGIMRAAYDDLTSSGTSLQGGSTITEQFVKNYYANITSAQTISNKIKEIYIAIKLAREKSKDWILTQYLNTIYFGDGAYGVQAAAKTFFGKPVGQLNVSQDAMIASMLNAPGVLDPTPGSAGYNALVARWKYVLQGMVTMNDLTSQQASAQKFPKVVSAQQQSATSGWTGYKGYIMYAVENELRYVYHYSLSQIDNGGLKIVTTISQPMMKALYATVNTEKKAMAAGGKPLPIYAHIGAVLEQPSTGAIVAFYGGPSFSEPAKYCKKISCQYDMALENREQVGSSFKPYVLSTAVSQGMNVKTSTLDGTSPLCVPSDQYPQQYSRPATGPGPSGCPSTPYGWYNLANDAGDSGTGGPQSVVYSTAASLNTAYADLAHRVGLQNVTNMAKSFGVDTGAYTNGGSDLEQMASNHQIGIALGQAALTVGEQANTFATLANNGEYNTPHVIAKITHGTSVVPSKVTHHEVLTPEQAADVDYALSFDTYSAYGTGTRAGMSDGRPIIGKTGTTNTGQSAFFLGAIPQYSLAVGMFTNKQNASTASNAQTLNGVGGLPGYGGDWPAIIWHNFAEKEFAQLPVKKFPTPSFSGTAWNLMGPGQRVSPSPSHTASSRPHPHPHQSSTCQPSPLNNDCGKSKHTSPPPSSSPPPSTSPPPTTCPPGQHKHCQPGGPLFGPQSATPTNGVPAADRARRLPVPGG